MKEISDERKREIAAFSAVVRKAGAKLAPHTKKDAERIRAVASYLGIDNPDGKCNPAVKKWWYEQGAPRGGSAVAILAQLARIASPEDERVELDAADVPGEGDDY